MPEICRFYGIIIRMYFDDHTPAHFHAVYGEFEAQIGIDPIEVIEGNLPKRAESMALEWAAINQRGLKANWERLRESAPAEKLPPLS